jgi:hypothetical protein
MSAPQLAAAAASVMPPATAGQTTAHQGPLLTPPVIAGPIAASSLGGVPFIAINGPVHHFSGKRLTELILGALGQVGVTIEIPE